MSGGSYNYLYSHTDELISRRKDVEQMRYRLAQMGHEDAAAATRQVLDLLDEAEKTLDEAGKAAEALADVWKAVEWLDSNDWGEKQVAEAVEKYRNR